MALYAVDDDDLIHAADAKPGKTYWCIDCFGPVKRRLSKSWLPHFYHLKSSPSCRLYSKTKDHVLAQLEIQKSFPDGAIQLEKPFPSINRVADAFWEKEKIVFEIQCSPITEKEVETRVADYKTYGIYVVWLLDDQRYNRRFLRPAESLLRKLSTYYMAIRKNVYVYDQFEVFVGMKRVKRGQKLRVDLQKIYWRSSNLDSEIFPQQLVALSSPHYFYGDRLHFAYRKKGPIAFWRALELQHSEPQKTLSRFRLWLRRKIGSPYLSWIQKMTKKLSG